MEKRIYIGDINKMFLLQKLWENAIPRKGGPFHPCLPSIFENFLMNQEFPSPDQSFLDDYIDYYEGRLIKCDISGDRANFISYDMHYGKGEFQRIVDEIRAKSSEQLK